MMKKSVFLIVLIVLIASITYAGTQSTTIAKYSSVNVLLHSQDPDPVEPGQTITVKFKVENEEKETTEDVIVRLLPKTPFKLYGDTAERNLGKLRASSTGADAVIIEYRLKVDEGAIEGDNELELEVQIGDVKITYKDDDFMIDVQTHDAILDITSIKFEPEQITPGQTGEVNIFVKNLADSLLKDIKFSLNFTDSTLPLAPYQSSSQRQIAQLQTNHQLPLNFKIVADPDASPGMYKVPMDIKYNDEKGNAYTIDDVLAVVIGEEPKLRAYLKKTSVMKSNSPGKITLELANAGSSDVKYLELTLLPSDDYQLVSTSDYIYIGDVDSDDTESEEFDVFIRWWRDVLHFPVLLKYYDANNNPFEQQFDLELQLYSSSKLKKFGVMEKSNALSYLLFFILVVGGIILYRKRKKDPEGFALWMQWVKKKIPFVNGKKRK